MFYGREINHEGSIVPMNYEPHFYPDPRGRLRAQSELMLMYASDVLLYT